MPGPRVIWMKSTNADLPAYAGFFRQHQDGSLRLCIPQFSYQSWGGSSDRWHYQEDARPFPASTSLEDACRVAVPDVTYTPTKIGAGEFYPRIWRPSRGGHLRSVHNAITSGAQVLTLLLAELRDVFAMLEPVPANAGAFGHKIRQLLFLASTEVENAWKAVLKANHCPSGGKNNRFCTTQYVKLLPVMRLDAYTVSLRNHPEWPAIKPFASWRVAEPTQSLAWYDAYNATKHDREENLHQARLDHAITAVAAAFVMLNAQFGTPCFEGPLRWDDFPDLSISCEPCTDIEFSYIPGVDGYTRIPIDYPFGSAPKP